MSALDQALLREDLDAPLSIATLVSLSPAQLALASLRPDLDFLTRQRAYTEFLLRRSIYRASPKRQSQEQPILEISLNFERRASLSDLSTSELVLLQFNPRCISAHEAETAQQLFFERALAQQADDEVEQQYAVRQLHVERCDLQYRGGVPSFAQDLTLEVRDHALVVSRDGEVMVQVLSNHISSFHYVTTVDGASGDVEYALKLEATEGFLGGPGHDEQIRLVVNLGRVGSSDPSLDNLRSTVAEWSALEAFPISLVETRITREEPVVAPPPVAAPPYPTPPPRTLSLTEPSRSNSSARSPSSTAPSPEVLSLKRSASDELEAQGHKRPRSDESCDAQVNRKGLWQFVDNAPQDALWHPGFLVRQLALLRAIMPHEPLQFTEFSPDELALLSRAVNPYTLPHLPWGLQPSYPHVRHRPQDRLALEHIYKDVQRLEVDTTRLVLLTDSYPDLRLFAKTVAKVQSASDLLKLAYAAVVLELERRIARQAPSTQDPLESLLEVVRSMQGSPEICCHHLYRDGLLIRNAPPSLTAANLGTGPLRRFEAGLMRIVMYEQAAGSVG